MAEEQGDKNEHISDAEKKMDALMDAIRDACVKMDEGGKRMDARMDAMEENFRRQDARVDAFEKDRKDADEEKEEKKADRKDSDEEKADRKDASKKDEEESAEKKAEPEKTVADRKDADEKEEKAEEAKDSGFITRAEAAELRKQINELQVRAPAIVSDSDRERFAGIQEEADPVFQAFNDRAPAPMDGETPTQYLRRLGSKLQIHSPTWKDSRLGAISDEGVLKTVVSSIYADAAIAARRGVDVPVGQLRMISRQSGGHTINEFEGEADSWMNRFAGNSQKATGEWRRPH